MIEIIQTTHVCLYHQIYEHLRPLENCYLFSQCEMILCIALWNFHVGCSFINFALRSIIAITGNSQYVYYPVTPSLYLPDGRGCHKRFHVTNLVQACNIHMVRKMLHIMIYLLDASETSRISKSQGQSYAYEVP